MSLLKLVNNIRYSGALLQVAADCTRGDMIVFYEEILLTTLMVDTPVAKVTIPTRLSWVKASSMRPTNKGWASRYRRVTPQQAPLRFRRLGFPRTLGDGGGVVRFQALQGEPLQRIIVLYR